MVKYILKKSDKPEKKFMVIRVSEGKTLGEKSIIDPLNPLVGKRYESKKAPRLIEDEEQAIIEGEKRKERQKKELKELLKKEEGKKIYFGANKKDGTPYGDYIFYNKTKGKEYADEKKKDYLARHDVREDLSISGLKNMKPGAWARWILWSEPTLKESVNLLRKKYGLDIKIE